MQTVDPANPVIEGTDIVALEHTGNVKLTGPGWQAPIYVGPKVRALFSHDLSLKIEYVTGPPDWTPPDPDSNPVTAFKGHVIPPDTARQPNGARTTLGMDFSLWFRAPGMIEGGAPLVFPVTVLDPNPAPSE